MCAPGTLSLRGARPLCTLLCYHVSAPTGQPPRGCASSGILLLHLQLLITASHHQERVRVCAATRLHAYKQRTPSCPRPSFSLSLGSLARPLRASSSPPALFTSTSRPICIAVPPLAYRNRQPHSLNARIHAVPRGDTLPACVTHSVLPCTLPPLKLYPYIHIRAQPDKRA